MTLKLFPDFDAHGNMTVIVHSNDVPHNLYNARKNDDGTFELSTSKNMFDPYANKHSTAGYPDIDSLSEALGEELTSGLSYLTGRDDNVTVNKDNPAHILIYID